MRRGFYGWWLTAGLTVLITYGSGMFRRGFTVFFLPIAEEFGLSRAVTAGAFSLARLEEGIEGPLGGWLTHRFGPRAMTFVGVVMVGTGFILLGLVTSVWGYYLVYGMLLALGFEIGFMRPCQQVVVTWFRRKRGSAFGLLMTAPGIGGAFLVPLLAWMVVALGWRTASIVAGVGFFVIGLPVAAMIRNHPSEMGLLPDGERDPLAAAPDPGAEGPQPRPVSPETSLTVKQALRTSAFWTIAIFSALRQFGGSAAQVHMIPLLVERSFDPVEAANATAFAALISVPTRYLCGWLGDRMDKRILLIALLLLEGVSMAVLATAYSAPWIWFSMALWGLGNASAPLHSALRADYFGPRHFAMIAGLIAPLSMIGSVGAPILAGWAFDVSGSYTFALQAMAVTFPLAAVAVLFLRRPIHLAEAERA